MKRTPLKRKVSLRDALLKRLKQQGTRVLYARNLVKRQKPLKKLSRSKRQRLRGYYALTAEFLAQPENHNCIICTVRREHGENIPLQRATEVHHWAGRIGRLLCYVPYFRASCFSCRLWPHQNQKLAREYGVLAPAHLWEVFPGDGN